MGDAQALTARTEIAPGRPLEVSVVPSIGSTAMAAGSEPSRQVPTFSSTKMPGASSLQTFADAHEAFEVDQAEHAAHGVGGGAVGLVLVALAEVFPGGERGVLGAADEVEVDDAFGVVADGWHGLDLTRGEFCAADSGRAAQNYLVLGDYWVLHRGIWHGRYTL